MKELLKNVTAVLPGGEKKCDIYIENGVIFEIAENIAVDKAECIRECNGAILMPGFIDTHNHGGLSRAFLEMDANLDEIVTAYAKRGTTAIAPTFSCRPFDVFAPAVRKTAEFAKTNKKGAKIPGIHSEGPFLNPVRAGGMYPEFMVKPTLEWFEKIYDACCGLLKIITLAPEMPGAFDVIEAAIKKGVSVSAGHTNATFDEMKAAIEQGVSRVTHTFNATRPFGHREPGVLGAAFSDDRVNCEVICDFAHLHPETVKLIITQKGASGVTVVSDYSDQGGRAAMGEGEHERDGKKYVIRNGVAWTFDGSVISNSNDMYVSVKNLYSIGVSLSDIAVMSSENPAKVLKIFDKTGSIEVGKAADLVLLDSEFNLISTFIDGIVY